MLIDTGIKLDENDRLDINTFIEIINTSNKLMSEVDGLEDANEETALEYYSGCAQALVEARVSLHMMRKEISKKYNVPYNFISRNGNLLIEEERKDE